MRFQSFESFKILIAVIVGLLLLSVFVLWITRAKSMNPQAAACVQSNGIVTTVTIGSGGKSMTLFVCCSKDTGNWMGLYWDQKGNVPTLPGDLQVQLAQAAQAACRTVTGATASSSAGAGASSATGASTGASKP
jgi:hypothetical protein